MAKIEVTVCDVCGTMENVCRYTMKCDDKERGAADLCTTHAEPLSTYFKEESTQTPTPPRKAASGAPRARKSHFTRVMSIEDIEAQRKKR